MSARKRIHKAFTLLEIILALSVATLVMFGCASIMFDLAAVAERLERGWSLNDHADGVEKFLRCSIINSLILYPQRIEDSYSNNTEKTLYISKPPESNGADDYALTFGANNTHPFFVSPVKSDAAKLCWLWFDGDKLSIIWRFANPEYKNQEAIVYSSELSKFVKKISYFYNDETGWKEESKPDTQTVNAFPAYIKIEFQRDDEIVEKIISLQGKADSSLL